MKKHFAVKLIPPRPDFAQTMTDDEKMIMQDHKAYWQMHMDEGIVEVFGPVLDPKGVYGFGILTVDSEKEVKQFIENDPSLKFNKVEYYPMMPILKERL